MSQMGALRSLLLTVGLLLLSTSSARADAINYISGYKAKLKPFLEKNCFKCHGEKVQKGKMRLDTAKIKPTDPDSYDFWQNVLDLIASGETGTEQIEHHRVLRQVPIKMFDGLNRPRGEPEEVPAQVANFRGVARHGVFEGTFPAVGVANDGVHVPAPPLLGIAHDFSP